MDRWGTPVATLFKVIAIVSTGTIIILANLDFIDRYFWAFIERTHK
jgi:hypothetical protein